MEFPFIDRGVGPSQLLSTSWLTNYRIIVVDAAAFHQKDGKAGSELSGEWDMVVACRVKIKRNLNLV